MINWKKHLSKLEHEQQWDAAIEYMQKVIKEHPEDMDAYMFMNFLLVNLIIEENYDKSREAIYRKLAKWYFDESYAKFSNNAEYLYITAKTAVMGEWLFGLEQEDYLEMIERAKHLEPDNLVYKENYYWSLSEQNPLDPELIAYAKLILSNGSPVSKQLQEKGAVGEYLLGMKEKWCEDALSIAQELQDLHAQQNSSD